MGSHARRTLIKPVDGKVRKSSYDLPADDNIYGMKQTGGDEGAQSLMTQVRWALSSPIYHDRLSNLRLHTSFIIIFHL